jgi:hypothetical protein
MTTRKEKLARVSAHFSGSVTEWPDERSGGSQMLVLSVYTTCVSRGRPPLQDIHVQHALREERALVTINRTPRPHSTSCSTPGTSMVAHTVTSHPAC